MSCYVLWTLNKRLIKNNASVSLRPKPSTNAVRTYALTRANKASTREQFCASTVTGIPNATAASTPDEETAEPPTKKENITASNIKNSSDATHDHMASLPVH